MKYIGIDYGTKRTGIAIAPDGKMAVVKETIHSESQNSTIARIKEIVAEDEVECIVVGLPLFLDGTRTEMTEEVERFVEKLRNHVSIPVQTFDERLTSEMAATLLRGIKAAQRDQVAAQIVLQNFLDQMHQ